MLHLLAFAAVYLSAVWTPAGQRAENALFGGPGGEQAWVHDVSGHYGAPVAVPPLGSSAMPALLAGLALLTIVAVLRRRWWAGVAAIVTVLVTVGATTVGKQVLPRPDLVQAEIFLLAPSFPSGHVAIAVTLTLAAVLVVQQRARRVVAAAGTVWIAFSAAAVLATYQHRPSDVLGATLLACAVSLCAARLLPRASTLAPTRGRRSFPAVTVTLAVLAAAVGGARTDSIVESAVFAATGLVCAALAWFAVRERTRQ